MMADVKRVEVIASVHIPGTKQFPVLFVDHNPQFSVNQCKASCLTQIVNGFETCAMARTENIVQVQITESTSSAFLYLLSVHCCIT